MPKQDFRLNTVEICRAENLTPLGFEPLFNRQAKTKEDLISLIKKIGLSKQLRARLLPALDRTKEFSNFCKSLRASWNRASPVKKESYHLSEKFLSALEDFAIVNLEVCNELKEQSDVLSLHLKVKPKFMNELLDASAVAFSFARATLQALHRSYLGFESQRAYT